MMPRTQPRDACARIAAWSIATIVLAWPVDDAVSAEADQLFSSFTVEQLEYRAGSRRDAVHWEARGWLGGDDHKLWLKTEGEKIRDGKLERAEIQLLYGRRISEFFDLQAGFRYDVRPEPERGFAVFGVHGLAPYYFELDAALFVSNEGEVSARIEAEYDLLITQKLILQPKFEINLAGQSVRERGIGSGINSIELGLRLRYEIIREFAPYIGVNWERKLGETARFARNEGEKADDLSFVMGVRFWF